MKIRLAVLFVFLAFAGFAAPNDVEVFSGVTVSLRLERTPELEYKYIGSNSYGSKGKLQNRNWAVIIVEFTPGYLPAKKKNTNAVAKGYPGSWLDDVTLDVAVEIPWDKNQTGMMTGECKFISIPMDGEKHVALMLIPPRMLERYMPMKGKKEYVAKNSDFKVQAIFRKGGKELGSGYFNMKSKNADDNAEYFDRLATKGNVVKNAVLPRNKTPWHLHMYDNYDLLAE